MNALRINPEQSDSLQHLRGRVRGKLTERGIWLRVRFRYEDSACDFADRVKALGGDAYVRKLNQLDLSSCTGSLPYRVEFSISPAVDGYLRGDMALAEILSSDIPL